MALLRVLITLLRTTHEPASSPKHEALLTKPYLDWRDMSRG